MEIRKSIQTFYGFILVKKNNGNICGRFPLTKKECTIGRDSGCDIRILLNCVSALHCIILYIDDKAYIRDKSLVGNTKVNGKKIGKNNFLLHQSDEIEIGGKIFVWEYADLSSQSHQTPGKKFGVTNDCKTPRVLERSLSQVNTPLDNNKIIRTPAKSNTKSSKTLLSINNTPIVVASKNMSRLSYEEAINSLKKPNSTVNSQSEPRLTSSVKSLSMVPGRNIPLFGDPKTTPRKSWVVTDTLNNSSSSGAYVLGKLSTERLKRDSTPEFNSTFHYAEEGVEFDTPDLSNGDLFDNEHVDELSLNNPSNSRTESNVDAFQSNNIKNLHDSEPITSRRDTYSLENGPIVVEQDSTPPPRRSILKCSKTTRPNRSRSNCRMVQFARLPLTDGRIKTTKSRLNKTSSFIVTDDVIGDTSISQDSKKDTHFDVEYDDDLDGVQPLDISVASLLNSPILDNSSVNRSSKRGSRGNKVMSLVSSFEKGVNESPKNSIRASDLLSMSGSKHEETPSNNDLQTSNVSGKSGSSARRINLENVFSAEDSQEQVDISVQDVEMTINSEANVSDNTLESEYTFSSPLNLHLENNDFQKDKSNGEIYSDNFVIQNNISVLDEESNGKVQNSKNVSKFIKKSTINENESLDVTDKQISDAESPSMIIQGMSEMFNSNSDELEITHQQHKKSIGESFVLVENDDLPKSAEEDKPERVNLETSTNKNSISVSLSESLNKSLIDAIELQLDQMHDDKTNSFNSKKKETESDSLLGKINNQTITSDLFSEETKITNTSSTSTIESGLSSKTKSLEISASNNAANVSESNENEAYSKKSADISLQKRNIRSSKIITEVLDDSFSRDTNENEGNFDKSTNKSLPLEAAQSDNKKESNSAQEEVTDLDNSKCILDTDNSKQLNTSVKSKNDMSPHTEVKKRSTRSSKMISEVFSVSKSKDIYEIEGNSEKTSNNTSTLITNDAASKPLETTKSNNEKESNRFLNISTEEGLSDLDNSKQLNKSAKSKNDISTHAEIKKRNTRSSKMVSEVLGVSKSKDYYENEGSSEKTIGNNSTLIVNDAASISLETTNSNNESESNTFLNISIEDRISDLDNSKQLNISAKSYNDISTHAEIKKRNSRSSKMISEVLGVSKSKDNYENESNSEETSNNTSTLITNDAASKSLETTKSNDEEESNKFLNKSKNDISTHAEIKKRNTRSSKMISEVLGVSTSRDTYENEGNSEKTSKKSPISIIDNESTLLFETTSNNKKNSSTLNNSKQNLIANNSKQLNESVENDVSPVFGLKNKNTCSSKKITKVLDVSTDETEDTKNPINLEHSSETSYGKPRYESTPWNSSKNSKIPLNSSIQPNETTYANTPEAEQRQEITRASPSTPPPYPNPEEWAIMMREFNESVKKKSFTRESKTKRSNLFHRKPNHSKITILVTTEEGVSSKCPDNETITPQIKNHNSIASCSSNNTLKVSNEDNLGQQSSTIVGKSSPTPSNKRSTRATKKSKAKKVKGVEKTEILDSSGHEDVSSVNNYSNTKTNEQSKLVLNTSSDDTKVKPLTNRPTRGKQITQETETKLVTASKKRNCSPTLPSPKINLRTRGEKNESNISAKQNTRAKRIVTDVASTASDTENMSSLRTRGRKNESKTSATKNTHVKKIVSDGASTASDKEHTSSLRTRKGENESKTSATKNMRVKKIVSDGASTASDTQNISSLRTRRGENESNTLAKKNMRVKKIVFDGASTASDSESLSSLRTRANKNGSGKSNQKIISDGASTGSDTETSSPIKISKKELRTKSNNASVEKLDSAAKGTSKHISSIRANKNDLVTETNNSNINVAEKSKVIPPTKARLTRSKTTLTESSLPKPDKKNKTSSPVETKSVNVGKTIQTKKRNQKSQPKRVLPSKPLKTKTSELTDSSEYESTSEAEVDVSELQLIDDQPTTSKKKKNSQKENISETSSKVLPQLSTRSRKRGADTPIFELNAKNSKKDISSIVPNTAVASVSNINHISLPTKRTRNTSKESQVSSINSSLESQEVDKKENSTVKTKAKKREIGYDDSSNDFGPSTRKVTRKVAEKNNKTEIKKNNTDERNHNTKVTFDKNIKTSNSPKPKKTRSTKQAVSEVNTTSSPVPVRKLRTREKKK